MTRRRCAILALAAALPAVPLQAEGIPALACHFDRTCTSETDCNPADLAVALTPGDGDAATLTVAGMGERPATTHYASGTLTASAMEPPEAGPWMLTLPNWPADGGAAFAVIAPAENRITAWVGTCAVAESAQ